MRTYERTHQWLKFDLNLQSVDAKAWMQLGEVRSKCEHIAGVPLRPEVASGFLRLYLARGVAATTAIEGNTLTPRQAALRIDGKPLEVAESKAYQVQELDNIIEAFNTIIGKELSDNSIRPVTPKRIKEFNHVVLKGLLLEPEVLPGQVRKHSVGVARYRGAPAEDCEYLLDRMCTWLNGPAFDPSQNLKELEIPIAVLKAILAHLYIEWIHPFGDGNGRTGRLVEVQILAMAGVPQVACHLLSNHYNETRPEYYQQLQRASESGGDVRPFLAYAIKGLVDGLTEQVLRIRQEQWEVSWRNFVYDTFAKKKSLAASRARDLLLELSAQREPVPRKDLPKMSSTIALAYAETTEKTLSRDLNALENLELVVKEDGGYRAKKEIILAFLPSRHDARKPPPQAPAQGDLLAGLFDPDPDKV